MDTRRVISHPVHLIDSGTTLNPTALVPFCSISDDYSAMGVKIKQIDVPVCNSFRPKIKKDQLCYTVDLNEIKSNKAGSKNKVFFTFFIDFNEDRELSVAQNIEEQKNSEVANRSTSGIIIEAIGKYYNFLVLLLTPCRSEEKSANFERVDYLSPLVQTESMN